MRAVQTYQFITNPQIHRTFTFSLQNIVSSNTNWIAFSALKQTYPGPEDTGFVGTDFIFDETLKSEMSSSRVHFTSSD